MKAAGLKTNKVYSGVYRLEYNGMVRFVAYHSDWKVWMFYTDEDLCHDEGCGLPTLRDMKGEFVWLVNEGHIAA